MGILKNLFKWRPDREESKKTDDTASPTLSDLAQNFGLSEKYIDSLIQSSDHGMDGDTYTPDFSRMVLDMYNHVYIRYLFDMVKAISSQCGDLIPQNESSSGDDSSEFDEFLEKVDHILSSRRKTHYKLIAVTYQCHTAGNLMAETEYANLNNLKHSSTYATPITLTLAKWRPFFNGIGTSISYWDIASLYDNHFSIEQHFRALFDNVCMIILYITAHDSKISIHTTYKQDEACISIQVPVRTELEIPRLLKYMTQQIQHENECISKAIARIVSGVETLKGFSSVKKLKGLHTLSMRYTFKHCNDSIKQLS